MVRVLACITDYHDLRLVAVAAVLCVLSTTTAIAAIHRSTAEAQQPTSWLAIAAVAFGVGAWSTHFVAMLAFHPGMVIDYEPLLTLLSAAVAIAGTWAAFAIYANALTARPCVTSGMVLGLAITALHYIGMAGIEVPARLHLQADLVLDSWLICTLLSIGGFWLMERAHALPTRVLAGAAFILAVLSLHFLGMAALTLTPDPTRLVTESAINASALVVTVIATAVLISAIAATLIIVDARETGMRATAAQRLSAIIAGAGAAVWEWDIRTRRVSANDRWDELLGDHASQVDELEAFWASRCDPESAERCRTLIRELSSGERTSMSLELRLRHARGHWVWVSIHGAVVERDRHGAPRIIAGTLLDISLRKQAEQQRRVAQETEGLISRMRADLINAGSINQTLTATLRELLRLHGADAALVWEFVGDEDNRQTNLLAHAKVNAEAPQHDSIAAFELASIGSGLSLPELLPQASLAGLSNVAKLGAQKFAVWPVASGGRTVAMLALGGLKSSVDAVTPDLAPFISALGELVTAEQYAHERRDSEERASMLARLDALTGLGNRRLLSEQFESRIDHPESRFSLVLIDLDRFKTINDSHGHLVGDKVLQAIAERLRKGVRGDCTIARLGGDEFAILTPPEAGAEAGKHLAERLLGSLCAPIVIDSLSLSVGASIGVAVYPDNAETIQQLLHKADAAMYRAKTRRGEVQFFDASMDEGIRRRAELESQLRTAVANDDIVPYFQPVVNLETGAIAGHEVLARWPHAALGFISPVDFIPIAEEAGLIEPLFWNILREACRRHKQAGADTPLAVNLSPAQVRDVNLPQRLLKVVTELGFPLTLLEIEVTESVMLGDVERARPLLISLKNQGVRIALDDFGTGYSSLLLLRELPIDKVKIDKSFISDLNTNAASSGVIVDAILGLAKALKLQVTAEGIENETTAALLRAKGCHLGQGLLFGGAAPSPVSPLDRTDEGERAPRRASRAI